MALPPSAAEVTSSSTLDFSTSGQSMWASGDAAEFNNTWTLLGFDTGLHTGSILDGAVGYSFQLAAALQAALTASAGSIGLDYPLDAQFDNPNVAAPGQQFTIDTTPDGLDSSSTSFDATLPQITAALQAEFKGQALVNYDIAGDSGSFGLQPFDDTVPLVTISTGNAITIPPLPGSSGGKGSTGGSGGSTGGGSTGGTGGGDGSPFSLTFQLPNSYQDQNISVGNQPLPTETLTADTSNIIAGNLDLLQLVSELIFGPEVPFPSGNIGPLQYSLASLTLSAGVGLAQQFTFVPTAVMADITAPWGESEDVKLGQDATFTVPDSWTGPIDLTTSYSLEGNLVSQAGIIGQLNLGLTLLTASLNLGPFGAITFGPLYQGTFPLASTGPIYLGTAGGPSGFALEGFNTINGDLSIALGNGLVDLPGSATIDTTDYSANATAVIQTVLSTAGQHDTATNIYDPVHNTGSKTAVSGKLNIEVIDPTAASYKLPAGFQVGFLEAGSANATLTGNSTDVLLAAAPGAGETDTLVSGGNDVLVGGQDGNVDFVITPGFVGEIVGLTTGDKITLKGVAFSKSGTVQLGPDNVLFVDEGGKTYSIQLHETEDFSSTSFALTGNAANTIITIKERPGAPSGLMLAAASDSGVKGDDTTNITKPTISGSGAAGDSITLYDGSTVVGTAKVGTTGSWSIKLAKALSEGPHTFTATETDATHTISNPSQALTVTIDTTPSPAPTGLLLDAASDTGKKGDGITSDATPTIDGHGTAGDTITLLEKGKSLGTATVNGAGDWSITSSTLALGKHMLSATDTDPAGNVSTGSTPLSLTIAPPPIGPTAPNQAFYFGTNNQYVVGTAGNDVIIGNSNGSLIDGLGGNDNLGVIGDNDTIDSGDGNAILYAIGNNDQLIAGTGNDYLVATGNADLLAGGNGNDTLIATGSNDTIEGGTGNSSNLIMLNGTGGTVHTGFGSDTVFALFGDDTITGNGENTIYLGGGHNTLLDASGRHNDTVTGFSQASGDRIHLTTDTVTDALAHATQINSGLDTLITLSDGSTITLKFVSHIDSGFFS